MQRTSMGAMTDTLPDDARAREDEWLVVRCQLGERPAFDELIDQQVAMLKMQMEAANTNSGFGTMVLSEPAIVEGRSVPAGLALR